MKNYFNNIETIEELKERYRKLAKKYHPDMGGSNEEFIEMNNQYEEIYKNLSGEKNNIDDGFREIINQIINLNLKIEICGTWIWVSGDTKPYKKELNSAGLWWANKKKMWYWHSKEDRKRRKGSMSMEKIREKYGTKTVSKVIKAIA